MAVTIQLPDGQQVSFDKTTILIGRDASCDIRLKDSQPQHASIRKMANRWIVESHGEWLLQAGDAEPGKTCWIQPGESIRLTANGPVLLFEPSEEVAPVQSAEKSPATVVETPDSQMRQVASIHQTEAFHYSERSGPESASEEEWFYTRDAQRVGPVASKELKHLAASKNLQPTDLVWKEGMDEWVPASTVRGLFPASAASDPKQSKSEANQSAPSPPTTSPPLEPQAATQSPAGPQTSSQSDVVGGTSKKRLFVFAGAGVACLTLIVVTIIAVNFGSDGAISTGDGGSSGGGTTVSDGGRAGDGGTENGGRTGSDSSSSSGVTISKADSMWDAGQKADAVDAYESLLSSQGSGENMMNPRISRRVMEYNIESGNLEAVRDNIDRLLYRNVMHATGRGEVTPVDASQLVQLFDLTPARAPSFLKKQVQVTGEVSSTATVITTDGDSSLIKLVGGRIFCNLNILKPNVKSFVGETVTVQGICGRVQAYPNKDNRLWLNDCTVNIVSATKARMENRYVEGFVDGVLLGNNYLTGYLSGNNLRTVMHEQLGKLKRIRAERRKDVTDTVKLGLDASFFMSVLTYYQGMCDGYASVMMKNGVP